MNISTHEIATEFQKYLVERTGLEADASDPTVDWWAASGEKGTTAVRVYTCGIAAMFYLSPAECDLSIDAFRDLRIKPYIDAMCAQ